MRQSLKRVGAGAGAALLFFAVELALVFRGAGAAGLELDLSGPFAAAFHAVRPQLPGLLARVGLAYAAFGAAASLAAWALASAWPARRPLARWSLWAVELLVLCGLLAWARAVARPALFDDVLPAALMRALVDGGEPWHARAALGCWLALHAALAGRRILAARGALAAASVSLAAVALFAAARGGPGPRHDPLLVLIGVDAFRPDRLSDEVAPHLAALSRDATVFRRAYTPIAQTQPAWRGLLTARWPQHTGVRYPLTPEVHWQMDLPTFPAALGQAGYQTVFWTDCSRFNYQGPASGFATVHEPPRGALNFLLEKLRFRGLGMWADNRAGAAWLPEFVDNRALAGIHDPIAYADRLAGELVGTAARGPALFAYHATAAHFPGDPVYPYYRKFVAPSEPLERRLRMNFAPIAAGGAGAGSRAAAEGLYDELLGQADEQVGIIVAALKEHGLYDGATVIVFSDHGESFHADTPELHGATPVHGARLSDEENRILLLVKPPRELLPGRVAASDALVRLIDIGPTLLELAGQPPLPGADGQSLVPLIEGRALPPRMLYAETGFTHAAPDAFDPEHLAEAPRTFEAYRVRPDGVIETTEAAHEAILREKDVGAFDGENWLVFSPRKDGSVAQSCRGACGAALASWLEGVR